MKGIDVNKDWVKKVSKADFLTALDHHKDEFDLEAIWKEYYPDDEPKKKLEAVK